MTRSARSSIGAPHRKGGRLWCPGAAGVMGGLVIVLFPRVCGGHPRRIAGCLRLFLSGGIGLDHNEHVGAEGHVRVPFADRGSTSPRAGGRRARKGHGPDGDAGHSGERDEACAALVMIILFSSC